MRAALQPFVFMALGLLLGGTAMATEEPKFEVLSKDNSIELRRYAPFVVAETWVEGDMSEASNKGFRAIAGYIFGDNKAAGGTEPAKIAMTAPVTLKPAAASQKIAMTAPVTIEPQAGETLTLEGAKRW
ncbi:MAG: heme-binding protein, partial [Rhodoferax sp.]|nr:heme-binding protein [Rhodoferax sp.]